MTEPTAPVLRDDPLLAVRPGSEYCRSCGGPWFGEVAYCPYCGRAAASHPVAPAAIDPLTAVVEGAALGADATQDEGASWSSWARPLTAGAVLGLVIVLIVVLVLRASGHSP